MIKQWSIHTPDMGGDLPIGTHLIYSGMEWCDFHKMYEHGFVIVESNNRHRGQQSHEVY